MIVAMMIIVVLSSSCFTDSKNTPSAIRYGNIRNWPIDTIMGTILRDFPRHQYEQRLAPAVTAVVIIPYTTMRIWNAWVVERQTQISRAATANIDHYDYDGLPPFTLESDAAVAYLCRIESQAKIPEEVPVNAFQCLAVYVDAEHSIIGYATFADRQFASIPDLRETLDNNGEKAVETRTPFFDRLRRMQAEGAPGSSIRGSSQETK
jgi:hypothetical protein